MLTSFRTWFNSAHGMHLGHRAKILQLLSTPFRVPFNTVAAQAFLVARRFRIRQSDQKAKQIVSWLLQTFRQHFRSLYLYRKGMHETIG